MHKILFRGKTKFGDWNFGDYSKRNGNVYITEYMGRYSYSNKVFPETVGQYTGLKDRNGVKIFEGDILKLKDYHHERIVYVFWGDIGSWCYGGDGFSDEYIFNSSGKEVIGNIHDNPELLKNE